ncbi:unnamed protein product [Prorocentrum cordatum]|uniref:Uncharacterized protein n=1 Tax=Prorocentrum cordatum TaxID=2364126 RepID=A0ABN9V9Q3_9DINO|nr:unnamed protein product [Polarella glacialis]
MTAAVDKIDGSDTEVESRGIETMVQEAMQEASERSLTEQEIQEEFDALNLDQTLPYYEGAAAAVTHLRAKAHPAEERQHGQPSEEQRAEKQPAEEQRAEKQPAEEQRAEMQPAEEQRAEMQPAEGRRAATMQPAEEQRAAKMQPAEERRLAKMQPAEEPRSSLPPPAAPSPGTPRGPPPPTPSVEQIDSDEDRSASWVPAPETPQLADTPSYNPADSGSQLPIGLSQQTSDEQETPVLPSFKRSLTDDVQVETKKSKRWQSNRLVSPPRAEERVPAHPRSQRPLTAPPQLVGQRLQQPIESSHINKQQAMTAPSIDQMARAPLDGNCGISKEQLAEKLKQKFDELVASDTGADLDEMGKTFQDFYKGSLIVQLRAMRPETAEKSLDDDFGADPKEPALDREERLMRESLEERSFKFSTGKKKGNAIAGRWARVMETSNEWSEKYLAAEGYPAKKTVREEWAKWSFHRWQKKREFSKTQTNSKKQTMKGVYMPLARLAWKFGGGSTGAKLAYTYAGKAVLMGGIFTKWCNMTDCLFYLYVEHSLGDTWQQSWTSHEVWMESGCVGDQPLPGADGAASAPCTPLPRPGAEAPSEEKQAAAAATGGPGHEAASGKGGGDGDGNGTKKKLAVKAPEWMKDFRKLRTLFAQYTSQVSTLEALIKADAAEGTNEWKFAAGKETRGELDNAIKQQ